MVAGRADDHPDMKCALGHLPAGPVRTRHDRAAFLAVGRRTHRPRRQPTVAMLTSQAQHARTLSPNPHLGRANVVTPKRQTYPARGTAGHDTIIQQRAQLDQKRLGPSDRRGTVITERDEILCFTRPDPQLKPAPTQLVQRERGPRHVRRPAAYRVSDTHPHRKIRFVPDHGDASERVIPSVGIRRQCEERHVAPQLGMRNPQQMIRHPHRIEVGFFGDRQHHPIRLERVHRRHVQTHLHDHLSNRDSGGPPRSSPLSGTAVRTSIDTTTEPASRALSGLSAFEPMGARLAPGIMGTHRRTLRARTAWRVRSQRSWPAIQSNASRRAPPRSPTRGVGLRALTGSALVVRFGMVPPRAS